MVHPTRVFCSELIAYCIYGGMESAQAVRIIFAVSPRVGDQICYQLDNLYIDVNTMLMSAIDSQDAVLRGYQAIMAFMRDRGLLEIVVVG